MNTENITWLTSPMKQTTFKVELAAETVLVHLSLQVFRDYVWVLLTEDANNAPGTIVRYDDPACGPLAYTYEGENRLNTVECVELLGLRDNPLTQLSSRVVMNTVRRTGDTRPVLLYNRSTISPRS
ncbi:hypothetical protein AGDE_13557 [Angomonas deanei]|uniref:Uncharacterized protein n=1 Tax=Angomonas deanei TaxID=59799 RepID=A0A7G2CEG7_9TRYP|nr:hypothetical protein AGDE_13557 [Angomonas deanei]CAD2217387.1 hypothetical protein, conserved [Angomonas deanei]|eukprot:EPY22175.1 hypothetical protein AGDE_13557 [Angomonas deanei]